MRADSNGALPPILPYIIPDILPVIVIPEPVVVASELTAGLLYGIT